MGYCQFNKFLSVATRISFHVAFTMLIDRVEQTLAKVRAKNLEEAEKMGMTIAAWHQYMSELGKATRVTPDKNTDTVIYNSADYVLSYLFPPNRKKKKK